MSRREYVEALAQFFEGGPYPEFADYGLTIGQANGCESEALDRAEEIKAEREATDVVADAPDSAADDAIGAERI